MGPISIYWQLSRLALSLPPRHPPLTWPPTYESVTDWSHSHCGSQIEFVVQSCEFWIDCAGIGQSQLWHQLITSNGQTMHVYELYSNWKLSNNYKHLIIWHRMFQLYFGSYTVTNNKATTCDKNQQQHQSRCNKWFILVHLDGILLGIFRGHVSWWWWW